MTIPTRSGDLRPYKDRVFIYMGKNKGWIPQMSVLNCNKPRTWNLLTEEKNSSFHYLERKDGKDKRLLIYLYHEKKWVDFDKFTHTPDW